MRRAARFALALVCGLALVTGVASLLVQRTARDWFERDLGLRAQLAVNGARRELVTQWQNGTPDELASRLTELTFDERILAAAACTREQVMLAHTQAFPKALSCARLAPHVLSNGTVRSWAGVETVPGHGEVHISAVPIAAPEGARGFVVLVQDLAFVERREQKTQAFILIVFAFLALAASAEACAIPRQGPQTRTAQAAGRRRRTAGTPISMYSPNPIGRWTSEPAAAAMIRLGGVPIGVAMPPTEGPKVAISIMAVAKLRLAGSDSRPFVRCETIDNPMGNIIAVVAVLLIHIEMHVATAPNTSRMRVGLPPTARDDSAPNAIRRSRPCANMDSASMKLPMKRKMMGSANGAKTTRAGAT